MPIYEYRCEDCGKKNDLFKQSVAEAELAQPNLRCERCNSPKLGRLLSRFRVGRAAPSEGEEIYQFDRMTADLPEDNPADFDQWAERIAHDD